MACGVRFDTLFQYAGRAPSCVTSMWSPREEFDAVKEMARLAREENEELKARIATLEAAQRKG